ncbi:hypothetical protein PLESTM_000483800 [Pleodorina starrii]|nr:hypothetical protein PLESTM_000483800 [Pleodorina starrii]
MLLLALESVAAVAVVPAPPPPPPPAVLPPAATYETLNFSAPIITTALLQVPSAGPRSRKYFAYWRAFNDTQDKSAATFDLDFDRIGTLFRTPFDQFCNGPIVLPDGSPAVFGGNRLGNKAQRDGRKMISVYNEATKSFQLAGSRRLAYDRWYPTTCITADNKVLIVGGTPEADKGPKVPEAELWDPARPNNVTIMVKMPPAFFAASWFNWYPFIALLPGGEIIWWGDRGGSITNKNFSEIYVFPQLPDSFPYRTMYWYTSSIVLNALKPDVNGEYNSWSMTIFGGAPLDANWTTPAANASARLDMYYCGSGICDNGWVIEDMGQGRVMATTTVLPNGKVLVHGGGRVGRAGWRKNFVPGPKGVYMSTHPAFQDLMYDPDAPTGSRYTLTATLDIVHMYHASSCLDLSGKVITSGCETCGMTGTLAPDLPANISRSKSDYDYRISMATPAEIGPSVQRPVIVHAPSIITRGSIFNVTFNYTGPITGATLAAPCANTHSINMNQRVLFLPAAAHLGYYQLFLLGANTATGRTYSEGIWVQMAD